MSSKLLFLFPSFCFSITPFPPPPSFLGSSATQDEAQWFNQTLDHFNIRDERWESLALVELGWELIFSEFGSRDIGQVRSSIKKEVQSSFSLAVKVLRIQIGYMQELFMSMPSSSMVKLSIFSSEAKVFDIRSHVYPGAQILWPEQTSPRPHCQESGLAELSSSSSWHCPLHRQHEQSSWALRTLDIHWRLLPWLFVRLAETKVSSFGAGSSCLIRSSRCQARLPWVPGGCPWCSRQRGHRVQCCSWGCCGQGPVPHPTQSGMEDAWQQVQPVHSVWWNQNIQCSNFGGDSAGKLWDYCSVQQRCMKMMCNLS